MSLAVTQLLAARSVPPRLAACLTAVFVEASRTQTLPGHWVTGGSVVTLTQLLTAESMETWRAGVFAHVSVVPSAAAAGARHWVASPIIAAGAGQLAVGAVLPRGTLQFTELPSPPQPAHTGAVGCVADSTVPAGARLPAAWPVLVLPAGVFAAGTGSSCWTNADACHVVTGGSFAAGTQVYAVLAIPASGAARAAVSSNVPGGALAHPCGGLTIASILALALLLTIAAVPTS